mmetsp:Transcript_31335/g.54389  ORF Transcript_31335/g.54389 Transcript_31335/m.54389 type:complete len:182 (+) Transcript_31335:45-590(+)
MEELEVEKESYELLDHKRLEARAFNLLCIYFGKVIKLAACACIIALYVIDSTDFCGSRVETALLGGLTLMVIDVFFSTIAALLKRKPQGKKSAYYLMFYCLIYWGVRTCYVAVMILLNVAAFTDDCDLGDGTAGSLILLYMIVLDLLVSVYLSVISCVICTCGLAVLGLLDTRRPETETNK